MSSFPTSVPTYSAFSNLDSLSTMGHGARHLQLQDDIAAIATRVGVSGSTDAASVEKRLVDGLARVTTAEANISTNTTAIATKTTLAAATSAALLAAYPVGSIYMSTVSTNPGTLLGFGTWVEFAPGRVLVGRNSGGGTFGSAGNAGGSETHFHWQTVGMDATNFFGEVDGAGSGHTSVITVDRSVSASASRGTTGSRRDGTYDDSSLQPYLTVYMWNRTA